MDAETGNVPNQSSTVATSQRRDVNKALLLRLVLGVVILVLFAIFAVQNSASTEVSMLTWDLNLSLIIVMLGSATTGVVLWEMAKFVDRRRKS